MKEINVDFKPKKEIKIEVLELNKDSYEVTIEPGDTTRYEFYIRFKDNGFVRCSSLIPVVFKGYDYDLVQVVEYATEAIKTDDMIIDYYIDYIKEHSDCNPWTARALCLAIHLINSKRS